MTDDILQTVETFLSYSDEKLEELSQKNQELKLENIEEEQKGGKMKKYLLLFLMPALFASITVDSTEIDFVLIFAQSVPSSSSSKRVKPYILWT